MIAALVPFRAYIVSWMFDEDDLQYLDPMDEAFASHVKKVDENKEDFVEENNSDGSDADEVGFSEYHGQHPDAHKTN